MIEKNQNKDEQAVVFCIGENYWAHLAVAIASVFEYTTSLRLIVFCESRKPKWEKIIYKLAESADSHVEFIEFDTFLVDGLKECGYLGLSTYYRLFVPQLLDAGIKKIIYLDSDLVVNAPIDDLFKLPINGHVIAARPSYWADECTQLAFTLDRPLVIPYFNCGVMVIDVKNWRKNEITKKAIAVIRDNPEKITFADQCALNSVIGEEFDFLSPEWNVTQGFFETRDDTRLLHISHLEIKIAKTHPKVIHYNGPSKPWHFHNNHAWKTKYVKIRRRIESPFYISDDFVGLVLSKSKRYGKGLVNTPVRLYHKIDRTFSRIILEKRINRKWQSDKRSLPLTSDHRPLYETIHRLCLRELGEFPNLVNCRDFNDRIQWLKLFDQDPKTIRCSDKIRVRDYIRERVGDIYLNNLYQMHYHFDDIDFDALPDAFVIKVNHDSGTVILVPDKWTFDRQTAREMIEGALKRSYG